jgi:protein-tyrosine phosphatase
LIRLLFVCHGNICRSPMAEFVAKDLAHFNGIEDDVYVESAATTDDEIWGGRGNPIYDPALDELLKHGIGTKDNELGVHEKRARKVLGSDYRKFDLIIGMDRENAGDLRFVFGGDPYHKVKSMLDWTDHPRAVSDPWFTRDFEAAWDDIAEGCVAMMKALFPETKIRVPERYGMTQ